MLEIQRFLLNYRKRWVDEPMNALEALGQPPYSLNIKRHPQHENLVQFTYDQIESQKDHPIVREARGLILDQNDNWKVIAHPFRRFYNDGEGCADQIDWSTAKVQEKVDGTLIIFYWYADRWCVATKGSPDAGGNVGDATFNEKGEVVPMTFKMLFWHACEYWLKGLSKSGEFDKNCTYMWELTSPWNRVVCDYTKIGPVTYMDGEGALSEEIEDVTGYARDGSRITLIGVRNNETLEEIHLDRYRGDVHYVVREFPLQSLSEVVDAAKRLDPLKQEGFVVVDANFNRVKIKSPAYVAIHHLRDGSPRRRLMDLIKQGENDEVLAYKILDDFPAEKKLYDQMREILFGLILQSEQHYATIKDIEKQKDFALEALKSPLSAALFAVRKGQFRSIQEFVLNQNTDKLLELVDKFTSKEENVLS